MASNEIESLLARVEQALADHEETRDVDTLLGVVVDAIDSVGTADDDPAEVAQALVAILMMPPLDEATVGESGHPQAVVDAVWRKAWALHHPDILALASRLAVLDAFWPRAPADTIPHKAGARQALEHAAANLQIGLSGTDAAWRAACAIALARRVSGYSETLDVLEDTLRIESNPHTACALAWAMAIIAREAKPTQRTEGDEADSASATGELSYRFIVWAAALGRAMSTGVIASTDRPHWVAVLSMPHPFPPDSGWSCPGEPTPSPRGLALRAMLELGVESPEPLVMAACANESDPDSVAEVVWRLVFDSGKNVHRGGVVCAELTPTQREGLRALTRDRRGLHRFPRLGLAGPDDARALLEATLPAWRPLDVLTPSGPHRWHLWRIWRAVVWAELDIGPAVEALTGGLEKNDIRATFGDTARGARLQRVGESRGPEHAARDAALRDALEAVWRKGP